MPLVNLKPLLINLGGDNAMLQNILDEFEIDALQYMESIEQCAIKGDTAAIILPAHTIKGQCMHVEMNKVIGLAEQIELLATQNSLNEITLLLPAFKLALLEGLEALRHARVALQKQV